MDLLLTRGMRRLAFEFKTSLAPNLSRGFWNACNDIAPDHTYVVIPEGDRYELKESVSVISLSDLIQPGQMQ
ncbi:hypothetical protein [Chitinivibrio alkaliphilus]|uniref:ATPase n=1 Tax=Chitinivibrio alkaliphilus ACht1 TaxID=1313304 RepID=U7D4X5_9BACT|nr:hypothetical protein [Chitinivibrio alkaliphilus]ERP30993.1 hypothetical protein CALK_2130 [Chitinivibrio alkaliphilus ACht1]